MGIELERIKNELNKITGEDVERHGEVLGNILNNMRAIRFSDAIPSTYPEVLGSIRMKVKSLQLRNGRCRGAEIYSLLLARVKALQI